MTDGNTTVKLSDVLNYIKGASHDDMVKILLEVLSWFKLRNLGNPFNYNRAFEFIVAIVPITPTLLFFVNSAAELAPGVITPIMGILNSF